MFIEIPDIALTEELTGKWQALTEPRSDLDPSQHGSTFERFNHVFDSSNRIFAHPLGQITRAEQQMVDHIAKTTIAPRITRRPRSRQLRHDIIKSRLTFQVVRRRHDSISLRACLTTATCHLTEWREAIE
jgi:hypothetical protein